MARARCTSCTERGVFFFKQKTAYEMRISDWSSDVCSSDLELTRSEAQAKIERLKVAIASAECEFNGARLTLGASFGMAVMMEADSGESLIARADADMYANKHSGQIGRAACRESGCQYVNLSVVALALKKKIKIKNNTKKYKVY